MTIPNITPLPDAPVRGDTEATFTSKANAFVAALPTLVTEINATGDAMDLALIAAQLAETNAETAETNAETAEAGAVGSANYKGDWSSLSGPLAIPASVSHTGVVWLLKSSLADVTASQPSLVNTDWIALTQPVQTGSLALTSEFTLEGDSANVGDLVGLYSNGKIKVIKNHPGKLAQNAATSTFVNAISLSTILGISVYRDESDGNKVKAQLYSIAGRKITNIGTPTPIASTSATYIHADKIDANNIIIVYQDTSDSSQGKAVAVNIAANVLTVGTPAVFNAAVTTYCKVAVLTTAKAVIVYRDEGNSNYGVTNTVAISGLVLTPATEVNFKTAAVLYLDVCRLSDTSAVVSFLGTSSYPEAVALTINPGIVVGTSFVLKSATTANTTVSRLTDTTFVAAYESSSLLYARLGTNSSGTITAGTELPIQANPSFLESCQLTATRVLVTGRNATVSNYGYYWIIDNTTGTTIVNSSSAAFNSGTTSHTFPSKILDNRVLIGYQDSTNYATSYVIDLSTETLQKITGIAKEAGVESDVIDVATAGEVDFLSGLVAGSHYYSSATGALSASIGDYEVGVAKSATNLKMNAVIPKVDEQKIAFIDTLFVAKRTPSLFEAMSYGIWRSREIKTTTGVFTVPSNTYYIGIACVGRGGNGASGYFSAASGGGGGGLSFSLIKVFPGQTISYSITGGVSACLNMTANPGTNGNSIAINSTGTASGGSGGTASGGDYNYSGGTGGSAISNYSSGGSMSSSSGGGGAGGGAGGHARHDIASSQLTYSGGGGGRLFPDFPSYTPGPGGFALKSAQSGRTSTGGGGPIYSGGDSNDAVSNPSESSGASLQRSGIGTSGVTTGLACPPGINPFSLPRLGLITISECFLPDSGWDATKDASQQPFSIKMPFGACSQKANVDSSIGGATTGNSLVYAGFGGGSGGTSTDVTTSTGAGTLGGSGGMYSADSYPNYPGYGGGSGGSTSSSTTISGGAAAVIFIY